MAVYVVWRKLVQSKLPREAETVSITGAVRLQE